jgi:hypothetical protein
VQHVVHGAWLNELCGSAICISGCSDDEICKKFFKEEKLGNIFE